MTAIPSPAPGRLRLYLRLGRVSNLPTVWSNVLAGILLAGGTPEPALAIPLLVALTMFYSGGMFLNDAFDHAYDREFRPERPIPAGLIGLGEVYAIGFGLMALGVALLALPALLRGAPFQPEPVLAGVALALLITYYDYRHKADPLSPLVMALCRAMIYVIGAKAVGGAIGASTFWGIVVLLGYLIGLTYVAKQENLTEVKHLWPLLFLAAPFLHAAPAALGSPLVAALGILLLAWVVYALTFILRTEGRSIPRCVISLIAGISLVDALLIAQATGSALWAAIAILGFALTLYFQKFVTGT